MLANVILVTAVLLMQEIKLLESASTSKRIVWQTFFDNLYLTCYGTCTPSANGFTSVTKDVRCEGNNVRLKCDAGHVIRVSFAFYGELEPGQELCKDVSSVLEQCRKDVSSIVSKDCDGKELCLFNVDNRRFGRFCQAKYFYLDIRHVCEFRPTTVVNFPTTTRRAVTTQVKTTTEKSTKIKPITIYKEESTARTKVTTKDIEGDTTTPIYTTNDRRTQDRETKSSKTSTSTSSTSKSSSSTSSSSPATTHVPMSSPGTTTKGTTPKKNIPAPNINTSVATISGRGTGGKASLYWLLTAHSLVTDKSFIKANSTHLALAVILSIFIALVLSVCFILDHCRREKRKLTIRKLRESAGSATEDSRLENGSPIAFELRRGSSRSKSRSRCPSAVANGSARHSASLSLDDINHNCEERDDRLPLIPVVGTNFGASSREEFKETAFIMRSSTVDLLPPPPAELLADSPQADKGGYLDDDASETSTMSIPPPVGFGDFDIDDSISKPMNLKPELKITSPTPTNSSVSSSHLSYPSSVRSLPKIDNVKRLNNEYFSEMMPISHDGNLLQNNVSVQTNDLRDTYDRQAKNDNPGHVSMKSPHIEVSDVFATTDKISNVGVINLQDMPVFDQTGTKPGSKSENRQDGKAMSYPKAPSHTVANDSSKGTFTMSNDEHRNEISDNAKRGRLLVIKTPTAGGSSNEQKHEKYRDISQDVPSTSHVGKNHSKAIDDVVRDSTGKVAQENPLIGDADIPNGTLKRSSVKTTKDAAGRRRNTRFKTDTKIDPTNDIKSETSSCTSNLDSDSTTVLPRFDAVTKQIFAVPKHRCGMGHSHPCVCIPLRTGTSSFICSCLENAKQKSSKCCMENCVDANSGVPYSSQRPQNGRALATDILRRKTYAGNIKRSSSLESVQNEQKFEHAGAATLGRSPRSREEKLGLSSQSTERQDSDVSQAQKTKTLPILQSKLKKKSNGEGVKTLDRQVDQNMGKRKDPKLIPVIVHTTGTSRSKGKPRFEKNIEKEEAKPAAAQPGMVRSTRSEDSDSSDRSDSTDGHHSRSLPTTPTGKRRDRNGRLSPICENNPRRASMGRSDTKSWPKRSPRFRIQVVESIHYDKRQHANEV